MRLDDFICLGRTVPEESRKYGAKVCMAGVSPELNSLIRIYPLPVQNDIICRHKCKIDVERNPQDNRKESWKLQDRYQSILDVSPKPAVKTEAIRPLLEPYLASSIRWLNDRRLSLGVLKLDAYRGFFRQRAATDHPDQQMFFEIHDEFFGANTVNLAPYVEFNDEDGHHHELQLREWGCYEWIRKNRDEAEQLWENLGFTKGRHIIALIGNQANRRTSWLIIKTFAVKREAQLSYSPPTLIRSLSYDEYIRSRQWKAKCKLAKKRARNRCQVCNTYKPPLDVHHRTYERFGHEDITDLIVLCRECHDLFHKHQKLARFPHRRY